MLVWLIEYFGAKNIGGTFTIIAAMTLPFWIAMIAFPGALLTRKLTRPFLICPLYCFVLILLLWKAYQISILPDPMLVASYDSARTFFSHPIAFLALFCNLQILNLFTGIVMYQKASQHGFNASIELILCYFIGALVLIPFTIRLILRRDSLL